MSEVHFDKDTVVHADHLSLQYGENEIFTDLCFTINTGSFTSVVGPNGAGKTQLMRTMIGLNEPSSGMMIRNFTLDSIGYVPQKVHIDPTFPITVREFLQTYIQPQGWWLSTPLPQFSEALMIDDLMTRQVGKLSGGQLQRVILGAVLSTNPSVLFLDEFSSGIDPQGQSALFQLLHRLNEKDGKTIIMISHDIDVTTQYADTVLCLNKEMICHGHPHEVFTAENFEKMYGIPLTKLQRHKHHDR